MSKINQYSVAEWAGITNSFLSLIRSNKKWFCRSRAMKMSERTGVSIKKLHYAMDGEKIYNSLLIAYRKHLKSTKG